MAGIPLPQPTAHPKMFAAQCQDKAIILQHLKISNHYVMHLELM